MVVCRAFVLIVFLLGMPLCKESRATHIVGGELNYTYLGNQTYQIRLTVYRDCFNGVPPFDNPACVGIFGTFFNLVDTLMLPFTGSDTIDPVITSPCLIPPVNICYERTTYTGTVVLPPNGGGYHLVYQRCCRNITINNLVLPDETGATYYAYIPGTSPFSDNSNPRFINWPPPFVCSGIPFTFDHSATDTDGDSLVYELCSPLNSSDSLNPMPQPPLPPPYDSVTFLPGYSSQLPLGSSGVPMSIDPLSGTLTLTPGVSGQFVAGICVKEFRNGVFLSSTRRDFQLNIVPCPTLVLAAFLNPVINCETQTVSFQNQSINAGSYFWDFGDAGTADTSTLANPTYTYSDTGLFTVSLIAYSFVNPGCADTLIAQVGIWPPYELTPAYSIDSCTNEVRFSSQEFSTNDSTLVYSWNFGDGQTSPLSAPSHTYSSGGTYTVRLQGSSYKGCSSDSLFTITLPGALSVQGSVKNVNCFGDCNGYAYVQASGGHPPYSYLWNDPASQNSDTAFGLCSGNYTVIITDQYNCRDSLSRIVGTPAPLSNILSSSPAYCFSRCIGTASGLPSGGNGGYSYLWSDPSQQTTTTATGLCPGWVILTLLDSLGCSRTDSIWIVGNDSLPAIEAVADPYTLYEGQSTQLNALTSTGGTYFWSPSLYLNSPSSPNPIAEPGQGIVYELTYIDSLGCSVSDTVAITLLPVNCTEPEIFIPNAFSPDGSGRNDVFMVRGNTIDQLSLSIYNRWGEKVFSTNDRHTGWNGEFKGSAAPSGVYVYYLEAVCYDRNTFIKKGNITLLR